MIALLADFWRHYLIQVLDVLLVAAIFYRIFLVIQGTRSVQVIMGVVVLALATLAVYALRLPTLSWLLHTFWMAWVTVLAVVFQPEIRSMLAQLGSQRLGRILLKSEFDFIDEIMAALKEAARDRMGMLIVLEQETGLRNFIETGTILNAEISKDLLLTLFFPRTILHDGAVIIQENRLVAAGCVLPLTNEPNLQRILGTRHRAAIGLTEISDAIVLIVSEETGTVSVARDGKLDRDVNLDDLENQLRAFYRSLRQRGLFHRAKPKERLA